MGTLSTHTLRYSKQESSSVAKRAWIQFPASSWHAHNNLLLPLFQLPWAPTMYITNSQTFRQNTQNKNLKREKFKTTWSTNYIAARNQIFSGIYKLER